MIPHQTTTVYYNSHCADIACVLSRNFNTHDLIRCNGNVSVSMCTMPLYLTTSYNGNARFLVNKSMPDAVKTMMSMPNLEGHGPSLAEPVANPHLDFLYHCSEQMSQWYIGLRVLLHPRCIHSLVLTAGIDSIALEQSCKAVTAQILHSLVAHFSLSLLFKTCLLIYFVCRERTDVLRYCIYSSPTMGAGTSTAHRLQAKQLTRHCLI